MLLRCRMCSSLCHSSQCSRRRCSLQCKCQRSSCHRLSRPCLQRPRLPSSSLLLQLSQRPPRPLLRGMRCLLCQAQIPRSAQRRVYVVCLCRAGVL